jgi:hypothetical protein
MVRILVVARMKEYDLRKLGQYEVTSDCCCCCCTKLFADCNYRPTLSHWIKFINLIKSLTPDLVLESGVPIYINKATCLERQLVIVKHDERNDVDKSNSKLFHPSKNISKKT